MASLKEIKDRIASVGGTLKITSAMKMVASAKLHKAQQAIGNMLPYEKRLHSMLVDLMEASSSMNMSAQPEAAAGFGSASGGPAEEDSFERGASAEGAYSLMAEREVRRVAIVAFASNSSLCGAFNSNAIREVTSVIGEYRSAGLRDSDIVVYSVGRKMAEAMRKLGFPSPADFTKMSDAPSYDAASSLAQELLDGFVSARFDKVELVYNHYKSTSSQPTTRQTYLPLSLADATAEFQAGKVAPPDAEDAGASGVSDVPVASGASEVSGSSRTSVASGSLGTSGSSRTPGASLERGKSSDVLSAQGKTSSASGTYGSSETLSGKDSLGASGSSRIPGTSLESGKGQSVGGATSVVTDLIIEPSPEALIQTLLPKVVRLRIFTTLLDSAAAEYAARTVAMQLATDNGNDLLQELTLEYNKGRQQKITSEILDLVGGSLQ